MFKSDDLTLIDQEISKFTQKFLSERTESLRQLVLDSPKQKLVLLKYDLTRLNLKFQKDREFQTLALVSWYLPDEIRFLVQMELSETWKASQNEVKEILLTSKDYALTWFMRFSRWTESDFFGNILNKSFVRIFNLTEFRVKSRKKVPRYTGYCRGYQDTNRGAPSSLSREHWAKRSYLEEEQARLERELRLKSLIQQVEEELLYLIMMRSSVYSVVE